jgi:hypothetical protein
MRKITTKHTGKRKDRIKQLMVGGILIGLMFLSVLGYAFRGQGDESEGSEKVIYRGVEFFNQNGVWVAQKNSYQFIFKYNPNQIQEINTEGLKYLNDYSRKPLYILSENAEVTSELYRNLFYQNQIVQRIQSACLNKKDCEGDLPIKTCENNFIIVEENEIIDIVQQENCVFIRGPSEDLMNVTDEFLFKILGIRG